MLLSTDTEKIALELVEAELKRSHSLDDIDILINDYKDVKYMYRQFCKLDVYCGLHTQDNVAKEKLLTAFNELDKILSRLTWKVLNKENGQFPPFT